MDSCSVKHCMMAGGIIGKLIPSFRSQIGHDDDQICNIHHFAPLTPPSWRGVQMMEMPYLRTTSDDSSSETCFVLMDDVTDDPKSSFRTGIVSRGP